MLLTKEDVIAFLIKLMKRNQQANEKITNNIFQLNQVDTSDIDP